MDKLADLTDFMEAQLEYFQKCSDLLSSIKSSWPYLLPNQLSNV